MGCLLQLSSLNPLVGLILALVPRSRRWNSTDQFVKVEVPTVMALHLLFGLADL